MIKSQKLFVSKKAFDLPFSWLFAIIAGGFILFIAIYAAVNFINISTHTEQSQSAQQLLNYLNPVVNGITSAYSTKIEFKRNTRIYFNCSASSYSSPFFGKQSLAFSEEAGFLKKWPEPGEAVSRYNKYIFSDNIEEGKTFYLFSKPFYAGFRVDDLIFINSKKYCFISAPPGIEKEVMDLNLRNINTTSNIDSGCEKNSIKVCFGSTFSGCNISVYGNCNSGCKEDLEGFDTGYVTKKGKQLSYFGSLIYAAIFSSPEIYECNIKRLSNKISELSQIYSEKINLLNLQNCNSIIGPNLEDINNVLLSSKSSADFIGIYSSIASMNEKNCEVSDECKVYSNREDCNL